MKFRGAWMTGGAILAGISVLALSLAAQMQQRPAGRVGLGGTTSTDGTWTGRTSQDKEITIVVRGNEVVSFRLNYSIPTSRCTVTRDGKVEVVYREPIPGTLDVNYARDGLPMSVINNRFVLENMPGSRKGASQPVFVVKGSFEPGSQLVGEVELTVVERVGESEPKTPCKRTTRANFNARRS